MPRSKLLGEVVDHLNAKWNPAFIMNQKEDVTVVLISRWEGDCHTDRFVEHHDMCLTVGDVCMSLEWSGAPVLYYGMKTVSQVKQDKAAGKAAEHIEEASLPSVRNLDALPGSPKSVEPESQSLFTSLRFREESRLITNSPFKNLFASSKSGGDAFSKCDDEFRTAAPVRSPDFELSNMSEFRSGQDENTISHMLSFSRHNFPS